MNNKLINLDDHLFMAIERLNEEDLTEEQIENEARRAEAIVALADKVIENSRTKLAAAKLWAEHGDKVMPMLPKIGGPSEQ